VVMVNSSWTKGHVDEVLRAGGEVPSSLPTSASGSTTDGETDHLIPLLHTPYYPLFFLRYFLRNGEWEGLRPSVNESRIVYPPCETAALEGFKLTGRERIIVSLAQFR
jgi:alpha-1,2-mannosyltransferase